MKKTIICSLAIIMLSCISTKSTIKNIDDSIPGPAFNETFSSFVVTKMAKDKKYAFNQDYPVNVGFTSIEDGLNNQIRFLNALAGPDGQKIQFTQKEACCPFPTLKTEMGAGTIDTFEITWEGQKKPVLLYINKFEKGELMIPLGFSIRK